MSESLKLIPLSEARKLILENVVDISESEIVETPKALGKVATEYIRCLQRKTRDWPSGKSGERVGKRISIYPTHIGENVR